MNFKQKLMACTALLGVWLFHPATAGAQSADAQKIEKLERQTELRTELFGKDFPASAAITVQGFAQPEMMIEVQGIAVTA